jgi:hypothetical protein
VFVDVHTFDAMRPSAASLENERDPRITGLFDPAIHAALFQHRGQRCMLSTNRE